MDIKELYQLYKAHPCITTDSRNCPQGSIFLALKGTSFNGNLFAGDALKKGCSYAIVEEDETPDENDSFIKVADTLQTFKDLAREHRRQFSIPVIAITGTNGKTTTKELVAAVLREKYNVLATEGNFNNDVGVPKTLFRLQPEHEIAVIEMGASHPGDIKTLVETVEPTYGLITNVGRAHLEGFGSFEGVKKTKGELYDFLSTNNGTVFLNGSDEDLKEMARQRNVSACIPYTEGHVLRCDPFLVFEWEGHTIHTHLIGSYNLPNALAAATVGLHFGVNIGNIVHALENYTPTNNRSQFLRTSHNSLIVDAYNANPTSMRTALESFAGMEARNKMAILGDMRELGPASREEHQKIVDFIEARQDSLGEVWLVGEEFGKTRTALHRFATTEDVTKQLQAQCPHGRTILIKGSNGMKLYELPKLL